MWILLGVFTASVVVYATLFSFLPVRLGRILVGLSLVLMAFLSFGPRFYLVAGGEHSVVINQAATGKSWAISAPIWFGDINNLGQFGAWVLGIGMVMGGVIGYKVHSDRTSKLSGSS